MNDSKTLCNACFCALESLGPAVKTASCASVEIQAANSGCLRRCTAISDSRRNPHIASKGVSAMAISGLWFESLYKSGLSLWSFPRGLVGVAWMEGTPARGFQQPGIASFHDLAEFRAVVQQ